MRIVLMITSQILDNEIREAEVRAALHNIQRSTVTGADGIPYKLLRNLDDQAIQQLTTFKKNHCITGSLPSEWRHGDITLIPKAGKPLALYTNTPISLSACLALDESSASDIAPFHVDDYGDIIAYYRNARLSLPPP
ncbi:uncharacterized protein LOC119444249 [Dermacentor silvarum]|uniref:uncharacterized protein LOC119444249 n=1 Tax=Dermacentor silvarum TaxID=543639 RepID=UPI00189C5454|nr:uncharacterized protein LOC119444249 [Dermacentor silvarum]